MTSQTFSVIGITDYKNGYKVRFTNNMCRRLKRYAKDGATRLDFIDLPQPMTKVDALKYMLAHPLFKSDHAIIEDALASRETRNDEIKVRKRPGRKPRPITTIKDILEAIND